MTFISRLGSQIRPSILIFLAAFIIRALHLISAYDVLGFEYQLNDGMYFDALATALLQGKNESQIAVVGLSPAYVGFLLFFYKIFGHELIFPRLAQIVLASLSCVGLFQIARSLFGKRAGWIAGLLAAFCGALIYFDMLLIKASLINGLVILFFWLMQKAFEGRQRVSFFSFGGIALMTASLLRMQLILTWPWLIWVWIREARIQRKGILIVGLFSMVVVMFASQLAWMGWFESAMKRTQNVPFAREVAAPQIGIHFHIGNHLSANGTYRRADGIRPSAVGHLVDAKKIAESDVGHALQAREVNDFWVKRTLKIILSDPLRWLKLEFKKIFLVVNTYEVPNSQNYDYWRRLSSVLSLPLVSYGWLMPLALLGWIRLRKDDRPMILYLKGYAVAYIAGLLLTFVTSDYRLPLYPVWILFAAFALDQSWADLMQKRQRVLIKTAFIFLLFFTFCNYETYLNKQNYNAQMQKRMDQLLSPKKPSHLPRANESPAMSQTTLLKS